MGKKILFVLLFVVVTLTTMLARDNSSSQKVRDKSVYLELLGPSNIIGISFDARLNQKSQWGYRIGMAYGITGTSTIGANELNSMISFPLEINFLTSKSKHKLELGLGTNLGMYSSQYTSMDGENNNSQFAYYIYSNIGYRYQAHKGFQFRVGISPSFNFGDNHALKKEPVIYPYLSFGYAF